MNDIQYLEPQTLDEASAMLAKEEKSIPMAGGTDIIGGLKKDIYPDPPEVLVSLQRIDGLDYIREEGGFLHIGPMTTLQTIAENEHIAEKYTCLSQAAVKTASPLLRKMGTIAGNICQENRCWYYRAKDNYFECKMKGGKKCYAVAGDNRIHSIFGGCRGCMAVNPSDTAPALAALGAVIVTTSREIPIEELWDARPEKMTVLERGELICEIRIPEPAPGTKSAFMKYATRKTIDFPLVNCAVVCAGDSRRIFLNAVSPTPHRCQRAEEAMAGKEITEETAKAAADAEMEKAKPLKMAKYKVEIARALVKRTLLACK